MIRFLGLAALLFIIVQQEVRAQGSTCAQTLRLARSTYEQGRLHELPGQLESCLKTVEGGFTKQERVEAYRILTLAYIYLEEPAEADKTMLLLLDTDHFYKPNSDVDPAEFIALYNKFRNYPIFRLAGKVGLNFTFASVTGTNYVGANGAGRGSYAMKLGFQGGAAFEKEIFARSKNQFVNRISIAPEVLFGTRSFQYSNDGIFVNDETSEISQKIVSVYKQTLIEVNGMIQFKLKKGKPGDDRPWNSYACFGPGGSLLMNASNATESSSPKSTVTGPDVDTKSNYKPFFVSGIIGAGVKKRVGEIYVLGELRYQYFFTPPIDPAHRTNAELTRDYGMTHNDFKQSSISLSVGVVWPKFKPKKLVK